MLLESDVPRVMILFLLLIVPLFLAACDRETAPSGQAEPAKGQETAKAGFGLESKSGLKAELSYRFAGRAAPDASFTGADGRDVSLSDYAGRPLLVNLWATWCAPCKAEMPTLDALAQLEEGEVTVIAVSQDLQGRKPVRAFFDSARIVNLEPFTDPDNALSSSVGGTIALPTTILYDSQGKEVWRIVGGVEWDDAEIAKLLDEAA
ncbi:MAG: TlpA disulfide reductase family protein [Sphingorhabdus sp.]|uniref:TlpA family protein disulfide reductase n=1 Tax=Sphingorhabdus sp. TaxID=1902408 RepID=UPI003CB109FF